MSFDDLQGKTLLTIRSTAYQNSPDVEALVFVMSDGSWLMTHDQDCCEHVRIVEVHGDPTDLRGAYVTTAEVSTRVATDEEADESGTWTFYRLCTPQGDLTIRWLGESNGYYSEGVTFERVGDRKSWFTWGDWENRIAAATEWTPAQGPT